MNSKKEAIEAIKKKLVDAGAVIELL